MTSIKKPNADNKLKARKPKRSPTSKPKLKAGKRKTVKNKRKRKRLKAAMQDGPAFIRPGSKAFAKLQSKWYRKLEDSGFEDIEWHDPKSGFGQNSPNLKHSVNITDSTRASATELWFRLWTNYYTWNYKNFRDKKDRLILKLYTEGLSYRQISKELKARGYKSNYSLFYVFSRINLYKDKVLVWNKKHAEGLLKDDLSSDSPNYVVALPGDVKAPWFD